MIPPIITGDYKITLEIIASPDHRDIHLAMGTSDDSQTGAAGNPFRISTYPEFDGILRRIQKLHPDGHTCFRLGPGTYFTQGNWGFKQAAQIYTPYTGIIGPADRTAVITLLDPVNQSTDLVTGNITTRNDFNILWMGEYIHQTPGFFLENLLFNSINIPPGSTVSGPRAFGSDVRFHNVHVTGVHGNRATETESFGLSVYSTQGNNIISDCCVSSEIAGKLNYLTAYSMGNLSTIRHSYLLRNQAVAPYGHAAYTVNNNITACDNHASGFAYFFHNDTDEAVRVMLNNNHGLFIHSFLFLHSHKPNAPKRFFRVRDNYAKGAGTNTRLVTLSLQPDNRIHNPFADIVFEGNSISNTEYLLVANHDEFVNIRFTNNVLPPTLKIHTPGANGRQKLSLSDNITESGQAVTFTDTK